MMLEEVPFIGNWARERFLGSGGFGAVILWKNIKTKEAVAVKKCTLLNKNDSITERQKERWEDEVRLMNQTQCENIVKTIDVDKWPDFKEGLMKYNPSNLPILVMEFCEGGDLRKVISKNSNCSGLPETEVRAILKALRNAIFYLHSKGITHRDIKPENIVLKRKPDDGIVYKITDLGYAKFLDSKSLAAGMVGTMEYLAPELLHSDKYSCSVDYWSFGLIAYEICTGFRPFLPHASVARWFQTVQSKKSHHICISEDNSGGFHYSSEMAPETRISHGLKYLMEKWLALALEWNPKQRGYVFEMKDYTPNSSFKSPNKSPKSVSFSEKSENSTPSGPVNVLKIFTMLDDILDKKIFTVFSLFTYSFISFEIEKPYLRVMDLRNMIALLGKIDPSEIEFIVPCYQTIELEEFGDSTDLLELYLPDRLDEPMLFVLKKDTILDRNVKPTMPKLIVEIFEKPNQLLKNHIIKQFYSNALHFLKLEQKLYSTAMEGIYNLCLFINDDITMRKPKLNKMIETTFEIKGSLDLLKKSFHESKSKAENLNQVLILDTNLEKMNGNMAKLVEAVRKIRVRFDSVLKRSLEVVKHKLFENNNKFLFNLNSLNDNIDLIRQHIADKQVNEKTHSGLVKLIYNCLKERDILLGDREFLVLQQFILDIKKESEEIYKAVDKALIQGEKYKTEVFELNKQFLSTILNSPVPPENSLLSSLDPINGEEVPSLLAENETLMMALGDIFSGWRPISEL